jgi:nitroreductase
MNFSELVHKRESCRQFLDVPIEEEKLQEIIKLARLAPSAVNGQPWSVIVVTNPQKLNDAKRACQKMGMNSFVSNAQALLVVVQEKDNILSQAISQIKDLDFKSIDVGIFTAFLVLAATSLGLGSCILGWFDEKQLHETLNIPKHNKVRLVISLGYPANPNPRDKKRKDINKISQFY